MMRLLDLLHRLDALLKDVAQDVRLALRSMWRRPGFAAVVVFTLALGIGATTAMFSVLDAVLLRALPYRSPEQLAVLWTEDPARSLHEGRSPAWAVEQWRCQTRTFSDIAAFDNVAVTLTHGDEAERLAGAMISPNLLPMLGIQPVLGRNISAAEAKDQERVVLLGHRLWQTRFGGSADAVGATINLDGQPAQVVGILPAGFQIAKFEADVWQARAIVGDCAAGQGVRRNDSQEWFVVGRLHAGATFAQAQTELSAIAHRLDDELPAAERNKGVSVVPFELHMVTPRARLALWMLGGAVLCVLFIAAANVASLSLARSVGRARELAVRVALGASSGRIVRQLLTESVVLAVAAGLIGTWLAVAGIRVIRAYGPGNLTRLHETSLDLRALALALVVSLLTGLLVGAAPAITTWRRGRLASGEGGGGGRRMTGGVMARRVRRALVVAEFSLAIILLVGAGLLVRSWWQVEQIDPGFKTERVLAMNLASPLSITDPRQRSDFYDRVLAQIRTLPAVKSVGASGDFFSENPKARMLTIDVDRGTVTERLRFTRDEVSVDFFETLGARLVKGRVFSIADGIDAPPVAIVNETMARRLWPGREAVGRRIKIGAADTDSTHYTVVGVVADMRRQGVEREPIPDMFVPLTQETPRHVDLFIRTATDVPSGMAAMLRAAVGRVDRRAPVVSVMPFDEQLGAYLAQRRFQMTLLTGFAAVALLLAIVGIYGLIQYSVATRTQEIGLRMAIGAQTSDIFRMVIAEGLVLCVSGLALGLVGALYAGRAAQSLLFGVTATDPWTFITIPLLLLAVAASACYFPARRATRIDPLVALRIEQ